MKQGKGQQNFAKRVHWSQQTPSSNNTREDPTHGHHQMVNSEIRLIIFFAAKAGEALYSQQKQDWELTVAQIMNSLLPNSDLNCSRQHQGIPQIFCAFTDSKLIKTDTHLHRYKPTLSRTFSTHVAAYTLRCQCTLTSHIHMVTLMEPHTETPIHPHTAADANINTH